MILVLTTSIGLAKHTAINPAENPQMKCNFLLSGSELGNFLIMYVLIWSYDANSAAFIIEFLNIFGVNPLHSAPTLYLLNSFAYPSCAIIFE